MKKVYLYVMDTLADWEPGFAIAELNSGRYFKKDADSYKVVTVGLTKDSITTLGGISITPDISLDMLNMEEAAIQILPGSDIWLEPQMKPVFDVVRSVLSAGIPVAAICGATVGLANAGILDQYKHTSNDGEYLKHAAPGYGGAPNYIPEPAVTDGNLITATGLAPVEFAREIFIRLDVMSRETLNTWYNLYTTREGKYFYALMESLPQQGKA